VGGQHHTLATFSRELHSTHCIGGRVSPRADLDGCQKSRKHRDSIPIRPAHCDFSKLCVTVFSYFYSGGVLAMS